MGEGAAEGMGRGCGVRVKVVGIGSTRLQGSWRVWGSREVRQAPQGPRSIWNPLLLAADIGATQEGRDPITQTHTGALRGSQMPATATALKTTLLEPIFTFFLMPGISEVGEKRKVFNVLS